MKGSDKISKCVFTKNCTGYFEYDIEGNVATIITDNKHETTVKQQYKRTDYYYDLVSGKVNELIYQHDSADQFMQIYEYDADNRITDVLTTHDSIYFEHDAEYEYYDHGPLAREVIGQRQVQGMDYAYTLNGWIKGINSSILNPTFDMGHDGDTVDANRLVARDAFGMTPEYFNGDYRAIGSSKFEAYGLPDTSLYNGNIAGATYSIKPLTPKTIGYKYTYDQLNRLNDLVAFTAIDTVNDKWNSPSSITSFQEKVTYDENGNIFKYLRHGNTIAGMPLAMDSLNYYYNTNTNQLNHVTDGVASGNYPNDIDNETSARNYRYNAIGQLAKDSAGGIDSVTWTVNSKIKKVQKHNGDSIVFEYDALGDRIEKRFYPHTGIADTTLYLREVGGNILAMYDRKNDTVKLLEWDIYGTKHLGTLDSTMRIFPKVPSASGGSIDSMTISYLENQKQYELDNHLGNVMVTVSDKKIPIDTAGGTWAKYYLPNIVSANDYYPFGMQQPGRSYQIIGDSTYRYGFNGKLKENSIYGANDVYDYSMRMFDPRLGRFLSMDPVFNKYPQLSPYQFSSDRPIDGIDKDGKEWQLPVLISTAICTWFSNMSNYAQGSLNNYVQGTTQTADYNNPQVPQNIQTKLNTQQAAVGGAGLGQVAVEDAKVTAIVASQPLVLLTVPEADVVELPDAMSTFEYVTQEEASLSSSGYNATTNMANSEATGGTLDYTTGQAAQPTPNQFQASTIQPANVNEVTTPTGASGDATGTVNPVGKVAASTAGALAAGTGLGMIKSCHDNVQGKDPDPASGMLQYMLAPAQKNTNTTDANAQGSSTTGTSGASGTGPSGLGTSGTTSGVSSGCGYSSGGFAGDE
jgi:RHS repeat-associated protein